MAMEPRVIADQETYNATMAEIKRLMAAGDPIAPGDAARLELLATLAEQFERVHFPIARPTPVEAILHRMEEQELTRRDLEPYLGSRSKVSEILSGRLPLSLSMIRRLHDGLGIPADILLAEGTRSQDSTDLYSKRPPNRGKTYLSAAAEARAPWPGTIHARSAHRTDRSALDTWIKKALDTARLMKVRGRKMKGLEITPDFLRDLARLSPSSTGPLLARDALRNAGIALVVVPAPGSARLDGAAIFDEGGRAVIGLTLRTDSVDSFWFALLHELSHLALHLKSPGESFFDDLAFDSKDAQEAEADSFALEALLPRAAWLASPARLVRTPAAIVQLAHQLGVHPAIVAGGIRREAQNTRILSNLVGRGQVRVLFDDPAAGEHGS